jgi:predicted nucleic acid-binding protein
VSIIVSETSPIRALAHLNLVGVLKNLFGEVIVPTAVDTELRLPPAGLTPFDLRTLEFVSIHAPRDITRSSGPAQVVGSG